MIRPSPLVAALAPYALADPSDAQTISLAQNESAFSPSPAVAEVLRGAADGAELYPDPNWSALRVALAATHGLDPVHLLCGAGSMELIGALVRAFAGPGDEVLAPRYGYLYVATATALAGARYVTAPERDFHADPDALLAAMTPRTRVVFLCNPGNPTGTAIDTTAIVRLRDRLPGDILLVIDQAYGEFDGQDPGPVFALAARGDTVVLRTFSKAYGLAGARIGWGVFPPAIGGEVRKILNPNNISSAGQQMAVAALNDQPYMRGVVTETAARRDRFAAGLRTLGLPVPESRTNFVLIPFADAETAALAGRALRAAGLMMRGMGGYGLAHCLRATIGPEAAMDRARAVIAETLRGRNRG
ncbi:MAG: aminotransferase class I/II-fold pyridoxal phosphate-dependent enzyme [Rhodobacteraceae bacterium]|nr:aminotransferase class I/II-fold pyridoxal phosphate-dependent enzyme [Paracoccaceae bacterium]